MRIVKGRGFADLFKPLQERFEQGKKTFNALAFGLTDYNAAVREVLSRYGSEPIKAIKICRNPVSSAVQTAMNVVSFGAFKKRLERSPHDELYHLFALITLADGTIITLDKQAQITLKVGNKSYKDSIDVSPPFTTLNDMLDKTKASVGNDAFFGYNAKSNNCQVFLYKFFESNGKATPEIRSFILQDVKSLFDDNLEYFSKFVTDLGSRVSTLRYGGDVNENLMLYK
jgi:hypothetical protein